MGKLVRQDPNDEPAAELLKKIAVEKQRLIEEKKIKKQKELAPITEEEKPFELPEGWEWVRLGDSVIGSTGKTPSTKESTYFDGEIPFIGPGQILKSGKIIPPDKYLSESGMIHSTEAQPNDILTVCIGGSIGKSAIVQQRSAFNQQINLLRPLLSCSKFLFHTINTNFFYNSILEKASGSATPIINRSKFESLPIPLAPISEQHRIVAKVDELMTLCDTLISKLQSLNSTALKITDSVVARALPQKKRDEQKTPPSHTSKLKKLKPPVKPVKISHKSFILRSFNMPSGYRSLANPRCKFHNGSEDLKEAAPVCLVGLNGSGKSNLIEAIADVFCFLELINLPWENTKSKTSKYKKNDHKFDLSYTITDSSGTRLISIRKTKKSNADFFEVSKSGDETPITSTSERLAVLPRRIIGYSSGLNETVSHTFLRTRTLYSQEVRDAAPPAGHSLSESKEAFDTRTIYMDYESNAQILLCNYIFRDAIDLDFIKRHTRITGVSSFELRFSRKIAGKSGQSGIARLTNELVTFSKKFARCAGEEYDDKKLEQSFAYKLDEKTKKLFVKEFKTAENLFLAMYKWSLLNALVLSDSQRTVYLKEDVTKGTLERPPVVPPKSRLFDVIDMKVNLSEPKITIDYSGLSDGEHQFVQVFGTILLFNEPGSLFLFDEPESHFNPEWRTKFNNILNSTPNATTHEYIISTHSPYIISGSRGTNVFKFTRNGSTVQCKPIDFETYGASFDYLLKKLFSIQSFIDEGAKEALSKILKRANLEEMESAIGDFAESREKRRLYEAILREEEKK